MSKLLKYNNMYEVGQLYHVYNQGNNHQKIFFKRENYLFFLEKVRKELLPYTDILAYCLMPNHFHFLVCIKEVEDGSLSDGLAVLLRSYTRAVNIQENRDGSLFRQKTKHKPLDSEDYARACFHYIHQNPVKDNLAARYEDWEYSSYREYAGLRQGTLPCKALAYQLIDIPQESEHFTHESKTISLYSTD
jgi:putative transposase